MTPLIGRGIARTNPQKTHVGVTNARESAAVQLRPSDPYSLRQDLNLASDATGDGVILYIFGRSVLTAGDRERV